MRTTVRIGLALISMSMLGCGTTDDAVRTITVFDLVRAFPRATVKAPGAGFVHPVEVDMRGDKRSGLFVHPPSSVEFPEVEVGADSVFTAGIGLLPDAWEKPGDGVDFQVSVRTPDDATTSVFSRYVDPKGNPDDRHWINISLPLQSFAGKKIHIILSTGPGPAGNQENDWSSWSEPRILLKTQ